MSKEWRNGMGFEQAWLNYTERTSCEGAEELQYICVDIAEDFRPEKSGLAEFGADELIENGVRELQNALEGMTGSRPVFREQADDGTGKGIHLLLRKGIPAEGYRLSERDGDVTVAASDSRGILYGIFALLRLIRTGKTLRGTEISKAPDMPLRMLNHWDNMDGSIERGYSGDSFFFADNEILINDRTVTYARLAASVGINAVVINNVNVKDAATWLITERYLGKVRELNEILTGYGIRLFLSLNYAAPVELGELESADPLDVQVRDWWKRRMELVFREVPGFGGFLIKADSEGRPGPFTYGRTHADGANMLAEAAAPYGGLIIWRCFVYNCQQDWRDYKTDRARSGYDNFIGLDGSFRDNVILQIKNGPMDFQVREPVHPLFGGLTRTNQMLEVQIAQEYTGQQRHLCYLIPMFREILKFRTYVKAKEDTVRDIVSGKTFGQKNCGMAAVVNTGNDDNWTGHDMAAANFYGFGRLAFDTGLTAEEIAGEWIGMTYGQDEQVMETIQYLLMQSWPAYESYTSPLGIGWMVSPNNHYGPSVDGYEYSRWGTYHRADHQGIGVDRSRDGTGYALLYREPNASVYDDKEKCPDELLLFFHHIPYTWKLRSGKTVIQHIYDTHFEGVEMVDEMAERFSRLQGKLPPKAYDRIMERFVHQKEHAREWCDQINSYFYRKSGISDERKRKIY